MQVQLLSGVPNIMIACIEVKADPTILEKIRQDLEENLGFFNIMWGCSIADPP